MKSQATNLSPLSMGRTLARIGQPPSSPRRPTAIGTGFPPVPPDGFITADEFAELLGISRSAFFRLKKASELPPPFYFGSLPRWWIPDVYAWIQKRRGLQDPISTNGTPQAMSSLPLTSEDSQSTDYPLCPRCGAIISQELCHQCGYRRCPSCGDL